MGMAHCGPWSSAPTLLDNPSGWSRSARVVLLAPSAAPSLPLPPPANSTPAISSRWPHVSFEVHGTFHGDSVFLPHRLTISLKHGGHASNNSHTRHQHSVVVACVSVCAQACVRACVCVLTDRRKSAARIVESVCIHGYI